MKYDKREIIDRIELGDLIYDAFDHDHMKYLLVYFDMIEMRFIRVSTNCKRILGYEREEMEGKPFMDFVEVDLPSMQVVEANRKEILAITEIENTYIKKNGERVRIFWTLITNNPGRSLCIGEPIIS